MRVGGEGVAAVISFYVFGVVGLSLLVLISPLIVVAVPLLIVLGPVGVAWWRGRRMVPRLGATGRWWLVVVSVLVLAMPAGAAVWLIVVSDDGPPPESFWLIVIGIVVSPLTVASLTYAIRWRGITEPDSFARR